MDETTETMTISNRSDFALWRHDTEVVNLSDF